MRVVHVFATGGAAYGTERTVLSVLRGLAKQGAEARAIVVVEPRAGGMAQPTRERLRECGAAADVIDAESRLPFAIGNCAGFSTPSPRMCYTHTATSVTWLLCSAA